MKEEALKSQALTEFLRAGDNYGRWAFFPNSNGKGGNLAVMKTDVDGRFSVLVGGRAFGSEAQDAVRAASAFLYNRNLEPLGLYDAHTHEVYASGSQTASSRRTPPRRTSPRPSPAQSPWAHMPRRKRPLPRRTARSGAWPVSRTRAWP